LRINLPLPAVLLLFLALALPAHAQQLPAPRGYINDFADVIPG
jgi:hypothetical protein